MEFTRKEYDFMKLIGNNFTFFKSTAPQIKLFLGKIDTIKMYTEVRFTTTTNIIWLFVPIKRKVCPKLHGLIRPVFISGFVETTDNICIPPE